MPEKAREPLIMRCFVLIAVLSLGTNCFGQPDNTGANREGDDRRCYWGVPETGARAVLGFEACQICHSPEFTGESDAGILGNEAVIWHDLDKHRQAFTVLRNDRSQKMARILGIVDPQSQESLVHRDVRCLNCHSSGPLADAEVQGHLLSAAIIDDDRFNHGVSCEGCHGPAEDWAAAHYLNRRQSNWGRLSPREKFEQFGFWDVRDLRTQARICLSCHVGHVEQGKVLTHEMYAAGHPPLPSFELNSFIQQQPRHWRFAEEKPPEIRQAYLALRGETYNPDELYRTRALLVSSLVTISEVMRLTADLIDEDVVCPTGKPAWPELSSYSCFACHHDLKRDGWRQSRSLTPTPGRPTLHEWPAAMAEVAADFAGTGDEFRSQLARVYQALDRRPFGQAGEVMEACRQFADLTDGWAIDLQERRLATNPDGRRLLELIALKGMQQVYDYDAARQLVWSYERILHEVDTPRTNEDRAVAGADGRPVWDGWLAQEGPFSQRQRILKSLESELLLDLRLGQEPGSGPPQESATNRYVEVDLGMALQKVADYDVVKVQGAFRALREAADQAGGP